jgi:hypothetical protein
VELLDIVEESIIKTSSSIAVRRHINYTVRFWILNQNKAESGYGFVYNKCEHKNDTLGAEIVFSRKLACPTTENMHINQHYTKVYMPTGDGEVRIKELGTNLLLALALGYVAGYLCCQWSMHGCRICMGRVSKGV